MRWDHGTGPFVLSASAPARRDSSKARRWDFFHSGEVGLTLYPELIPCFFYFLNQGRQMSSSSVDSSLPSALVTSLMMGGTAFHRWWFLYGLQRKTKQQAQSLSINFKLYRLMGEKSHPFFPPVLFLFSATTATILVSRRNQRWRLATFNVGEIKSTLTSFIPEYSFSIACVFSYFFLVVPHAACVLSRVFHRGIFPLLSSQCHGFVSRFLAPCIEVKPK